MGHTHPRNRHREVSAFDGRSDTLINPGANGTRRIGIGSIQSSANILCVTPLNHQHFIVSAVERINVLLVRLNLRRPMTVKLLRYLMILCMNQKKIVTSLPSRGCENPPRSLRNLPSGVGSTARISRHPPITRRGEILVFSFPLLIIRTLVVRREPKGKGKKLIIEPPNLGTVIIIRFENAPNQALHNCGSLFPVL